MNKTEQIVHFYNVDPLLESAQDVGKPYIQKQTLLKRATYGFTTKLSSKKVNPTNIKIR